jgi:hypothetical protein
MKTFPPVFLLLALTLSSCVVGVMRPEPVRTTVVSPSKVIIINRRIGLPAYPNSRVLSVENKENKDYKGKETSGSSKIEFETGASFNQVYGFFDTELSRRGWFRTELSFKSPASKLSAKYQRQNEQFELKLDQQGKSNRYKLEIRY